MTDPAKAGSGESEKMEQAFWDWYDHLTEKETDEAEGDMGLAFAAGYRAALPAQEKAAEGDALSEALADNEYLLLVAQGIKHFTGCDEEFPCERCRREAAESALAAYRSRVREELRKLLYGGHGHEEIEDAAKALGVEL